MLESHKKKTQDTTESRQTDLKASLSAGGGRCEASVKAIVPALGGEARRGRPSNGSGSGEAVSDFLTLTPPQTGRGRSGGPEPVHALKGPAAGTTPPYWGCWVLRQTWTNRDLSFQDLDRKTSH